MRARGNFLYSPHITRTKRKKKERKKKRDILHILTGNSYIPQIIMKLKKKGINPGNESREG